MEQNLSIGKEQYSNANNLNARIYLNSKFSTNKYSWPMWIFDRFDKKEDQKVLELGCGTGLLWQVNGKRIPASWDITLSDYSKGMVEEAKKNIEKLNSNFSFKVIDAENIELAENSFDTVIASNMLYHLRNRASALSGIRRVLKDGGVFYAATGGLKNLQELKLLIREYKNPPGFDPAIGDVVDGFSLENGEEQLARYFDNIELVKYENSLEITEPEAIINYYLSFNDMKAGKVLLEESEIDGLRKYLNEIMKLSGLIHVTKDSGVFICR
jgi:ubiquinone/menaquinone biosynthesis C-methylase UbiE